MIDGGFQEESEARNKWNRARLTSTQLSTYFVGSVRDLGPGAGRPTARRRRRRAIRAAPTPCPNRASSATFGQTPGFDYRDPPRARHLARLAADGAPAPASCSETARALAGRRAGPSEHGSTRASRGHRGPTSGGSGEGSGARPGDARAEDAAASIRCVVRSASRAGSAASTAGARRARRSAGGSRRATRRSRRSAG